MTITSINLTAGVGTEHVTVNKQDGIALPPANITWLAVDGITITPDDTGFVFAADASVAAGTLTTEATYTGPGAPAPVVGPSLSLVVESAVTALEYTSP